MKRTSELLAAQQRVATPLEVGGWWCGAVNGQVRWGALSANTATGSDNGTASRVDRVERRRLDSTRGRCPACAALPCRFAATRLRWISVEACSVQ